MRSASVSIDRMIIQEVFGSSCVPKLLRSARTGATSALEPTTPPATRSEWPPTYLVSEYMTRSAPCSSGFWNTGPRKVLSTATGGRDSALLRRDPLGRFAPELQVHQAVGGIGRRLGD